MLNRRNLAFSTIGVALSAIASRRGLAETGAQGFEIAKTDAEWRNELTPEQYDVLRNLGTERPRSSPLDKIDLAGEYRCAGCGQPLFSSETKFNSGTGWPSFTSPLANALGSSSDRKLTYVRAEVHCRRCGGHLGHVFDDGPAPTGKRYCINGIALKFVPKDGS
jgi:peptide-methionine (R)-S-oxide reductase